MPLLHPDSALKLVLGEAASAAFGPAQSELLPLSAAFGRVLAEPLVYKVDQPPFDKATMDGFAYAKAAGSEGNPAYRVVGGSGAAGLSVRAKLNPGEAARVMTGAPVPMGSDGVERIEFCELSQDGQTVCFKQAETARNIVRRGANARAGDALLGPCFLEPQDIGILASSGYAEVPAARRPKVGVVSTGDELVAPGAELGPASIYDSNGPALSAQILRAGAEPVNYGIAGDSPEALAAVLEKALDNCDIVLLSGGVSMGNFDYVPSTLEALGVKKIFHKIAFRPGKPCFFGVRRSGSVPRAASGKGAEPAGTAPAANLVFGLPGNPMAAFVLFEFLVRPAVAALMGAEYSPRIFRARLSAPLKQAELERVDVLPLKIVNKDGEFFFEPLPYSGSTMLSVLACTDALARLEIGTGTVPEGSVINARLIRS